MADTFRRRYSVLRSYFFYLIKLNHFSTVITLLQLIWQRNEFRLVPNQSVQCNYSANLMWFIQIREIFLSVQSYSGRIKEIPRSICCRRGQITSLSFFLLFFFSFFLTLELKRCICDRHSVFRHNGAPIRPHDDDGDCPKLYDSEATKSHIFLLNSYQITSNLSSVPRIASLCCDV